MHVGLSKEPFQACRLDRAKLEQLSGPLPGPSSVLEDLLANLNIDTTDKGHKPQDIFGSPRGFKNALHLGSKRPDEPRSRCCMSRGIEIGHPP
jgi:hypothetical protein